MDAQSPLINVLGLLVLPWLAAGVWGLILLFQKGCFSFFLNMGCFAWIFCWWAIAPLLIAPIFLGPITLLIAYLMPGSGTRNASKFETLAYHLPVQAWVQGQGFHFGVPEGWIPWSADTLAQFSALIQQPALAGAQKTLPDGSDCWLAVAPEPSGISEFNKQLRATPAQIASGYRQGGHFLLSKPRYVLIAGEPSMVSSVQLANGGRQEHVATSHHGRSYGLVFNASYPQLLNPHLRLLHNACNLAVDIACACT